MPEGGERALSRLSDEIPVLPVNYLHILDIMRDVAAGRDVTYRADEAQALVRELEPAAQNWVGDEQEEL